MGVVTLAYEKVSAFLIDALGPNSFFGFPFLPLAFIAAIVVERFSKDGLGKKPFKTIAKSIASKKVYLHPSAIYDYKYVFTVQALFFLLFTSTFLSQIAGFVEGAVSSFLIRFIGPSPQWQTGPISIFFLTFGALIFNDLIQYFSHYLQHKVPFFWEFHKVHHSAEVLTPITGGKFHLLEIVLIATTISFSGGIYLGTSKYFFGTNLMFWEFFNINFFYVFYASIFVLFHSNVWWLFPRWLCHIFMSPAQHQIHHSKNPIHYDKNMGSNFAIWDYLMGTLYIPEKKEKLVYGLSHDEELKFNKKISTPFILPFQNIWRSVRIPGFSVAKKASP